MELGEALEQALEACAKAEQQHGSQSTRAAWVAVLLARHQLLTGAAHPSVRTAPSSLRLRAGTEAVGPGSHWS